MVLFTGDPCDLPASQPTCLVGSGIIPLRFPLHKMRFNLYACLNNFLDLSVRGVIQRVDCYRWQHTLYCIQTWHMIQKHRDGDDKSVDKDDNGDDVYYNNSDDISDGGYAGIQ